MLFKFNGSHCVYWQNLCNWFNKNCPTCSRWRFRLPISENLIFLSSIHNNQVLQECSTKTKAALLHPISTRLNLQHLKLKQYVSLHWKDDCSSHIGGKPSQKKQLLYWLGPQSAVPEDLADDRNVGHAQKAAKWASNQH